MRAWELETPPAQYRRLSPVSHARRAGTREHSSRYHIRQSECSVQTYCQKLPFQASLQYVQYQKF